MTHRHPNRSHLAWLILIVGGFFVRCDCGCFLHGDDDHPTEDRSYKSSSYRSVGEPCLDDFSSDESWGCGGANEDETCARNLTCCPNPAYEYGSNAAASQARYLCVASDRCGSSSPGQWCSSHRDCPIGYDCVGNSCRAALGTSCSSDNECTTNLCRDGLCAYPLAPDQGLPDSQPIHFDASIEVGTDGLDAGIHSDASANDADADVDATD